MRNFMAAAADYEFVDRGYKIHRFLIKETFIVCIKFVFPFRLYIGLCGKNFHISFFAWFDFFFNSLNLYKRSGGSISDTSIAG